MLENECRVFSGLVMQNGIKDLYLNAIENNDPNPNPGMQAVEVGNPTLIMVLECSINTNDTQG